MSCGRGCFLVLALLLSWPAAAREAGRKTAGPEPGASARSAESAAERILGSLEDRALREFVEEVLERNPGVAAAEAQARAALHRAPQVRALPDPVASVTAFVAPPETRVGPQRASVDVSQVLPWSGILALEERAALHAAKALEADARARRLEAVTEARRLYLELAFVGRLEEVTRHSLTHLEQHEEISRARYSTGIGLGQGVLKLQAEITRVQAELLGAESRRATLLAKLNALRDRPSSTPVPQTILPAARPTRLAPDALLAAALDYRPELAAADARIWRAEALTRLAEKRRRPDFTVGFTYTLVEPRSDLPGRLQPPEDNGDDIFGFRGGIRLPVWRKKLAAAVQEAAEGSIAAHAAKRETVASIEAAIGDLTRQVPLSWRQLRLMADLMIVQAETALELAQAGYVAGTLNALDLLHAEHVVFEARIAMARSQTDYLVALAELEGAIGGPLPNHSTTESSIHDD